MNCIIVNTEGGGSRRRMGVSLTNLDGSIIIFDLDNLDTDYASLYDLQGRKLLTPQRKGVYIYNGKKAVMR